MKQIVQSIEDDLKRVEAAIDSHLDTNVEFISDIARYMLSSGGKRIRPMLLILSAHLCNYFGERIYDLSAVIEFIHTATLLHDDVIDNAHLRRGYPTVNSRWGNEISILIGDYLYSKAMSLSLADKDFLVMQTISEVTMEMAKGQVIETLKQRDLDISEADYYQIISLKTASLFAACCTLGAVVGGVSPQQRAQVMAFGHELGMAFQMADDTLDFVAPEAKLGKPVHSDLKEGKITLPIITVIKHAAPHETQTIADYLHSQKVSEADSQEILAILNKYNALQATMARAQKRIVQAKERLRDFVPSPAWHTLHTLADFVVSRDV
ncbi:Octaprenyl diphosphate synthase [Candidatus Entotheonellaceae bacterium PAL068K]